MKKIGFILLTVLSVVGIAQPRFGLRFSPTLALNRVASEFDTLKFKNFGSGIRYNAGIFFDFPLSGNVAFNGCLSFATKRTGVKLEQFESVYNTQHVQIPLGLKFFTDDIIQGLKIYFLVGGLFDVKISEKVKGKEELHLLYIAQNQPNGKKRTLFQPFDAAVNIGTGVEYKISSSNSLFAGISYQHGLINMFNPLVKDPGTDKPLTSVLATKVSLINLDMGIKF